MSLPIRMISSSFPSLAALFLAGLVAFSPVVKAKTVEVTLVLVCDTYEMKASNGRGGFARIMSAIKTERAGAKHVFVAHAGDAISPSLMSGFDRGEHIIDLLNMIRPDAFVPGNHEYDFGEAFFKKRMSEARFPIYAANLREQNGQPVKGIQDSKILEYDGVKIGIFGVTAEDSKSKSDPGTLQFAKALETAKAMSQRLRQKGADLILAITHTRRELDWKLQELGTIDVILSGDDHDLLVAYDGDAALVEAKQDGEYLVAVDLKIDLKEKAGKRRVKWWPDFRIIDTATLAPDKTVARRVAEYQTLLSGELDVTLGTITTPLDSRSFLVRTSEAAIGNLIADAMRAAVGADMALVNGGGIRGNKRYPAGHAFSRRDVLTELPFRNLTMMFEMSGAQIRRALENGLSSAEAEFGKFPQISGARLTADLRLPPGKRITSLYINGKPLNESRLYKVATNDYMARGQEGYDMFPKARQIIAKKDAKLVANDVMVYIRRAKTLAPKVEGRIVIRK